MVVSSTPVARKMRVSRTVRIVEPAGMQQIGTNLPLLPKQVYWCAFAPVSWHNWHEVAAARVEGVAAVVPRNYNTILTPPLSHFQIMQSIRGAGCQPAPRPDYINRTVPRR